ncbi:PREDICTED: uncharacterized protein LOC104809658 [Tarenaya hassleriana]|uniref:uncharacterized protein LOC104809658 n=1 Tax=Tarenaya hassleriana TaxID=28532 RepID=UPI0008FD0E67|nr:PREDICTED: uncharacterized protein LOC104809658 [Tarenaya hassleriana]
MDPKSASETKTMTEEASKEQETKTTESMEMADSSVKKRKAEEDASDSEYASDPEDDGEDGEMEVENEAGKEGSSSSDDIPEWGVDSFDGAEYESPDDDHKYLSDEEANLKVRRYLRQIHETRGFEVDRELIPRCIGGYHQVNLDGPFLHGLTGRRYMEDMAKLCLEKYNQIEASTQPCLDWIVYVLLVSFLPVLIHDLIM